MIRRVGRRLAKGVARRVGKDDLFEQPGERTPQGALPPKAPSPTPARAEPAVASRQASPAAVKSGPVKAAPAEKAPAKAAPAKAAPAKKAAKAPPASSPGGPALPHERPTEGFVADVDRIRAALGPGHGLRFVNHWASWCLPCIEEFPHLIALHGTFGGRMEFFGISWDMFDKRGDQEDIVEHIENYADGHGVGWPSLLVDEAVPAEEFFQALDLRYQKIPQTWIIDDSGTVVERIDGVIDAAGVASLSARLEELLA